MATRDEKLKKINAEMLSDEELENIFGGTTSEVGSLIAAIGKVYPVNGFNSDGPVTFNTNLPFDEVVPYLKKYYGIDAKLEMGRYDFSTHDFVTEGNPNEYSLNGQPLTHQQVLDIIKGK